MNPTNPEDLPRQTPRGYFSYRGKTSEKTPTLDDDAAGPAPWLPAPTPARSVTHLPTPTDTASTADGPEPRRSGPPRTRYRSDPLDYTLRLQPRDRVLTRLLDEHRTLTTNQITAVPYDSYAMAERRQYRLRRVGWLERFTSVRATGHRDTRWVLGPLGAHWAAGEEHRPPPSARAGRDQGRAIAASTHLEHTDGANGFFIALLAHTRTHPGTGLARWWSPARCAGATGQRVHPDGHGVWEVPDPGTGPPPPGRLLAGVRHRH